MRNIRLGSTGIVVPQNAFGALPVQRTEMDEAVRILRRAYEGGMRYIDTARAYTDSEEKLGRAFGDDWPDDLYIATKTMAKTPEGFWRDLNTSLEMLRRPYVDVYQFHMANVVWKPGDGTGMYECMLEAKDKGLIKHIGITAHKIGIAEEAIESRLYETLQFPFSYLAGERELALVDMCQRHDMGYIAMKGLAGGLINNSRAAMAYLYANPWVLPIWGIQRMGELEEWLSYMEDTPVMDEEITAFIEAERAALAGDFCRGCGYCMPCPKGIEINNCARMSLMLRRAPSASWLNDHWQAEMAKVEDCIECYQCKRKCPYELDTPELLRKNLEDYKRVLAGEVSVS